MADTRLVIDREKLLDALGARADKAKEHFTSLRTDGVGGLARKAMWAGISQAASDDFDLVAKFPSDEAE